MHFLARGMTENENVESADGIRTFRGMRSMIGGAAGLDD